MILGLEAVFALSFFGQHRRTAHGLVQPQLDILPHQAVWRHHFRRIHPSGGTRRQHCSQPVHLRRRNRHMNGQTAVAADQPALGQVEPHRFAVRNPPLTMDAVVQARHKSLALRQVQQKAGQQRPPWLIGEGQARQRVQQEHEGFLRGDAGLDDVLDDAEEVRSDGQAVEISAQGIERLHQVCADDGKVIAALVQLKIAQGEQLAGVEDRGARFAASAGKRLNAPLRRAEEGQHPVVVAVIGVAENNRGVFGLFHSILPKRLRTVAHAQPLLICLLVRNQGREVDAVTHLAALRVRGGVDFLIVQHHGAGGTAIEVVGILEAKRARQLCRAPQVEAD